MGFTLLEQHSLNHSQSKTETTGKQGYAFPISSHASEKVTLKLSPKNEKEPIRKEGGKGTRHRSRGCKHPEVH